MYTDHTLNLPIENHVKKPQSRLFQRLISCQPSFALYFKGSSKRKEVEQYIHDKYQNTYHAELNQYMPCLLSMESGNSFNSTLGIRSAKNEVLFVEQYTQQAIEELMLAHCNISTNRDKIVEIGNLAAVKQGSSQLLLVIMVAFLYRSGYHWATASATDDVQKITDKLGFTTYKLCKANPDKLEGDAEQWGSYYETKPYVIVGDLRDSYKRLQQHRLFSLALSYFDKNITAISAEFNLH